MRCWYDCDMDPVSAIIQAGGQSRRMGTDKALIDYHGRPILAHVIDTLRQLSDDVLVVSNRSDVYSPIAALLVARLVPDYDPPSGPLGGIAAGLSAMRHELAIVVACDMPFLNLDLIRYLIERATDFDAVVPQTGDQYEPLHAVYRRSCLVAIQRRLANNERRVISFFQDVRLSVVSEAEWRVIDPTGRSVSNLNTPADLTLLT
jgi:molybdopterin-guanine dinucleotide biosynthesis protein A